MDRRKGTLGLVLIAGLAVVGTGCAKKTSGGTAKGKVKNLQSVYFDFDRSDIRKDAENALKDNAAWLKTNAKTKIVIEGNCDERGTPEYNLALGDRRARAARSYLVNLGVEKDRISTVSFGEEKPTATCHDESCWSKNRRGDFKGK